MMSWKLTEENEKVYIILFVCIESLKTFFLYNWGVGVGKRVLRGREL